MRLVKDTSPGAYAVMVVCIGPRHDEIKSKYRTGRMFTLAEGYADLDGEPFVAYYCTECVLDDPDLAKAVA